MGEEMCHGSVMGRKTELRITQDILDFTVELYGVTQALPHEELYGLQSQMRRAAVSIGSNVVEGSRRGSDRDFSRFLAIAEASAAELAYQLRLTADLEMISSETFDRVSGELDSIRRRIRALDRTLDLS